MALEKKPAEGLQFLRALERADELMESLMEGIMVLRGILDELILEVRGGDNDVQ